MIELAPNHKIGLSVANPILLAGGSIGYGEAVYPGLNLARLGAVTVGPLSLNSRAGSPPPRLTLEEEGFALDVGLQNRGLDVVMRNFSRLWSRLGCPVLVQVAESNPRSLSQVVQRIDGIDGVVGIELWLPDDIDKRTLRAMLHTVTESCDLPILVKLPIEQVAELAEISVQNEASGLIVGSFTKPVHHESTVDKPLRRANLYGPVVFPKMLQTLQSVIQLQLDCSLIACGGIYSEEQVRLALEAGALAVQIDSAIWTEPGLPESFVRAQGNKCL